MSLLSPQQSRVLGLLEQGALVKEIAEGLRISQNTVKKHLQKLYRKVGAQNGREAIHRCRLFEADPMAFYQAKRFRNAQGTKAGRREAFLKGASAWSRQQFGLSQRKAAARHRGPAAKLTGSASAVRQ